MASLCRPKLRRLVIGMLAVLAGMMGVQVLGASQDLKTPAASDSGAPTEPHSRAPQTPIEVHPDLTDEAIKNRIDRVLAATGWFEETEVDVREGVVFLSGFASTSERVAWAQQLSQRTEGVVTVVNRLEARRSSAWDFSGAKSGLASIYQDVLRLLPTLLFGLLVLSAATVASWVTTGVVRRAIRGRVRARVLRGLLSRGAGFIVFLAGVYIVLRVAGLTQLALTVVGGTGLVGLALGIAFRDIAENYLASIFLSVQRPFESGDLVEIEGIVGYVRQLNIRTTVLITLDGNLAQLPNAMVYKGAIRNYTATPSRREDFVVGIGYDDPIDVAQQVALRVLFGHPAVLKDPEPWVLADNFGPATVNLRVYFWLNGREHSWLKVRSSVLRLVKRAFQQNGISMPDESREVIFPRGLDIRMGRSKEDDANAPKTDEPRPSRAQTDAEDVVATEAEGNLSSEAGMLEAQTRAASPQSENLLKESTS